ncbi:hypothetical protein [Methanimicrococcus hongohii]|uniref:hypothetical protein n=1 Tax=Methanimicrococcus hongohii TaxID=3028295 RepID=UPI00292D5F8B|nr:hypothetical protein [Methanimicrococcus sp. Hf6]
MLFGSCLFLLSTVFCCQLPAKTTSLQLSFNVAAANPVCVCRSAATPSQSPLTREPLHFLLFS